MTQQLMNSVVTAPTLDTHGYSARLTAKRNVRRGIAWHAELLLNRKVIGVAANNGDGGQTSVQFLRAEDRGAYETVAKLSLPNSYEPESRFAEILLDISGQ